MKESFICIEWDDACSNPGYYDKNRPERFKPVLCKTVGHLVVKNKHEIIVASELFEDGDRRNIHTIPRKMVNKIRYLEDRK